MDSVGRKGLERRYNAVGLSSIAAFANVSGRVNGGCKDVYFIRACGVNSSYINDIEEMDRLLTKTEEAGRGVYARALSLPALSDIDEVARCSAFYERWLEGGRGSLETKAVLPHSDVSEPAGAALNETLEIYRKNNPNANSSMEKSFAVKLLYWFDVVGADFIDGWDIHRSMKCVFHNIQKEQEFYFCYMLTCLGIDVLLLQSKHDIDKKCAELPCLGMIKVGDFGDVNISGYDKNKYKGGQNTQASAATQGIMPNDVTPNQGGRRIVVDVTHPTRGKNAAAQNANPQNAGMRNTDTQNAYTQNTSMQNSTVNNTGVQNNIQTQRSGTHNRELDFEELARLASSVVMIAVHDRNGNVAGTGSGIMIGQKGYILTNSHVAFSGLSYSVRIEDDDTVYKTDEIIKYNQLLDLAIIRIQRTLKPLTIYKGEKPLVRGQKVVAIGSPLGLFNSVSDGIIAGFRKLDDVDMIQFTAPISHGSSGGAVLNMFGEVIGISTAGFDDGQNINLAVGYEFINSFIRGFTT